MTKREMFKMNEIRAYVEEFENDPGDIEYFYDKIKEKADEEEEHTAHQARALQSLAKKYHDQQIAYTHHNCIGDCVGLLIDSAMEETK
jgi:hypothetical protein